MDENSNRKDAVAMWSFGIVMTQSSGLTTVSAFLAELLGKKENTVRQQLFNSLPLKGG
ncbi:hypothetical protein I8751_13165 [Nostocaceae cyanobacterium CENA357]|uniref:Uncharacterized protein n=1 Tax=Atlanticothrix silvestris CENA357 TaxID=1725252 RepID=A0A8J7HDU9_9CYAN|nr:hypothetical protein [Atlanticothrix silvestris]MBH8553306.1 hypothetical protein [Atlanticothrix silvestris CENA357]